MTIYNNRHRTQVQSRTTSCYPMFSTAFSDPRVAYPRLYLVSFSLLYSLIRYLHRRHHRASRASRAVSAHTSATPHRLPPQNLSINVASSIAGQTLSLRRHNTLLHHPGIHTGVALLTSSRRHHSAEVSPAADIFRRPLLIVACAVAAVHAE